MPKLKTKKGVAKRFKLTKKGKVKYHACGKGHLLTNKDSSRIRSLRRGRTIANKKLETYLTRMLPYG
ncbi:MAG: 50S ribosomal protein L35 [Candidatus Omnitrophica bacterium]|jgi:large subunit ribosomal protein L35|nr:50S ribosomal protein L35 [Candidatus Omnitrophota bacterium]